MGMLKGISCERPGEFIRLTNGGSFKDELAKKYHCGDQEFEDGAVIAEFACSERCMKRLGWLW